MVIPMIDKLKIEDEKELQNFLTELDDYTSSDKKYYIIPLPDKITDFFLKMYDDKYSVDELKKRLSYLNMVCEYYEEYDYIISYEYYVNIFTDRLNIDKVKITEEHRNTLKRYCELLKEKIENKN